MTAATTPSERAPMATGLDSATPYRPARQKRAHKVMFCRIDLLTSEAKVTRVISSCYITAAGLAELEEVAERQRRARNAQGFRLLNMHTGEITETWG